MEALRDMFILAPPVGLETEHYIISAVLGLLVVSELIGLARYFIDGITKMGRL